VLGRPVAHSLSPVLHRAAYAALGLDWTYTAIDCGADDLAAVLASGADCADFSWAGFSCTMPLKRAVLDVADEVRPAAARVGAGNTLLPRPGGGWIADNTDLAGVDAALAGVDLAGSSIAVLGAGGTGQAVIAALAARGAPAVTVVVRSPERAAELCRTAERCGVEARLEPWSSASALLPQADVVVSTVPAGAADPLAPVPWRREQVLFDVLYEPWPTPLAAAASRAGADVRSGAVMLLHQAAAQVELMTGRPAPLEAMRDALRAVRPDAGL
jgi:shikimate dehydrogenase